jgi:Flp pilus assembly protein TadG
MALVLTVLLALTFGVMEYGHYVYARHTLEGASQRGGRTAILSDITESEVSDAVQEVMASAGYDTTEYTLAVTGLDDGEATDVTVTVSAVWGTIGIRPMGIISADSVVQATVTMRKEGP